jgi:hypothetical protein
MDNAASGNAGQGANCPKCHAPLATPGLTAGAHPRTPYARPTPLGLRLFVLLLLIGALATPLVKAYYLHEQEKVKRSGAQEQVDRETREKMARATATAKDYLKLLHAKDTKSATAMMSERARSQFHVKYVEELMSIDKAGYEITDTKPNGQLFDVTVVYTLPEGTPMPKTPIEVDKNPVMKLVLGTDDGVQWRIESVGLVPKKGTASMPEQHLKKQKPLKGA